MLNGIAPQGRRALAIVVVGFAAAAGIAYAAVPDSGTGVYHACVLKTHGTMRIIDPATTSCRTSNEFEITFAARGAQGVPGPQGAPGPQGPTGADGVSPTVTQLSPGEDAACPTGGARFAAGSEVAYACHGEEGADGASFSGTFTSPNGQYSITVDNTGVIIRAPGGPPALWVRASGTELHSATAVSIRAGTTLSLDAATTTTLRAFGGLTLRGDGNVAILGGTVSLNGGAGCPPAARVGDTVAGSTIVTGAASVCIG